MTSNARRPTQGSALGWVLAGALVSASSGCRSSRDRAASVGAGGAPAPVGENATPAPQGSGSAREPSARPTTSAGDTAGEPLALIERLGRAEAWHRGTLFDLGAPGSPVHQGGWALAPDPALQDSEHDGATWARVFGRQFQVRFVQDEPAPLFFALRARGGAARTASVLLDGKPVGILHLFRGQIRTLVTHTTGAPVAVGPHTLAVRFPAGAKTQNEPLAEVDWLHAGESGEEEPHFAAPTPEELLVDGAIAGVPHRSIGLRAPSSVGFALAPSRGARLRASVGFEGAGEADADVVASADGQAPVVLGQTHLRGGDKARWTDVDLPLDQAASGLVTLKLRAREASPGGRVLFGDPSVVGPVCAVPPRAPARLVIVLVLGGVDRTKLVAGHPALAELQRSSAVFDAHRNPTTVSAGVMASLLTGVSPRAHTVEDAAARLPDSLTTLATAARDGSVQTAMFTGSPATFAAFGFARGWDKYAAFSPVDGDPAVAPMTQAGQWILSHMKLPSARALVVIHARGGHPPWDVASGDAVKLPPADYSGSMEPRRSAQILSRARGKHARFHLTEADRTRMWAIYEQAMNSHDAALGEMIEGLRRAGLWSSTLFAVTSDAGFDPASKAPFGDGEELSETMLAAPLWVHFPDGAFAGQTLTTPTQTIDLPKTVLAALSLAAPDDFRGQDLRATAAGCVPAVARPVMATLGPRFSMRLGSLVLSGMAGRTPSLCDLSLDPLCQVDRGDKLPRALASLWGLTYETEEAAQKVRKRAREPATVDPDTQAAIAVWGE